MAPCLPVAASYELVVLVVTPNLQMQTSPEMKAEPSKRHLSRFVALLLSR